MSEESTRLRLPYWAQWQAQAHVTVNEALTTLDTLVQLSVLDKDLTAPPGSPVEGDCYIVAASATGGWVGWDGRVARFIDGAWRSYLTVAGWLAYVQDEAVLYVFDGLDWLAVPTLSDGDKGDITVSSAGTVWTIDNDVISTFGRTLTVAANAGAARTTLGLVIGSDVQAFDAELAAIAGLTSAADKFIYFTGSGTAALADVTSTARSLLDDTSTSAMRTTLGVAIGSNVQAFDADLDALAALSGTNTIYYRSASNTWSAVTIGSGLSFSGGTLANTGSGIGGSTGSVDNALVRADGAGGATIQAGGANPAFAASLSDNAELVLSGGTAGFTGLSVVSTDAGVTGPTIELFHDTASPAAFDIAGNFIFFGRNSGGSKKEYARVSALVNAAGTADGALGLAVTKAGVETGASVILSTLSGTTYFGPADGTPTLGAAAKPWSATYTTTLELGNASDTTLARSGAGDVTIEGNVVYRAGGTDVAVADGGTGASSATAYSVICGGTTSTGAFQSVSSVGTSGQVLTSNGAGALPTWQAGGGGGGTAATQSDQETATSTTTFVSPGRQQFHPSAAKAWGSCDGTASTLRSPSYGLTSVTNGAAGVNTWNWSVTFSSSQYTPILGLKGTGTQGRCASATTFSTTSLVVTTQRGDTGANIDPVGDHTVAAFGDL